MEAILGLAHLNALLLLQVVGADGAVSTAGVNALGLLNVREDGDDVLFLVIELDEELAGAAVPNADGTILATRQNVA